ncbi:MAG: hypothetical protein ABSA53_05945 [Streptosporangiaceae bacterium]|jgi:hypothetical protein
MGLDLGTRGARDPLQRITPFSVVLDEQPAEVVARGADLRVDLLAGHNADWPAITQMPNWIKANGTGPSIFWNFGDGTLPLDIPDATAAFKAAFGTGNALAIRHPSGRRDRPPCPRRIASASANDRPRARSWRSRRR